MTPDVMRQGEKRGIPQKSHSAFLAYILVDGLFSLMNQNLV